MEKSFDLNRFNEYKENNCLEVKKAQGGLPSALWETYSSFANSSGGVIVLGVGERQDGSLYTIGLKDVEKLKRNFWNSIHDRNKVSINILAEKDVVSFQINNDTILVINVPRAKRDQKPVYINGDLFGGSYRRDWEGDYHCSEAEVKAMLRDAVEETSDMKVLQNFDLSAINKEALTAYRNYHRSYKPNHAFHRFSDEEYLIRIGAAVKTEDDVVHPTAAGLLMFGEEYNIVREFPEYFLDYREMLDPTTRWTDRVQSASGDWSGNIQDFFFRVNGKISNNIKIPFKLNGITRVEDTPVHKAIREALVNCLVNADYYMPQGVVIKRNQNSLIVENPGNIRTGKEQMLKGGISDPRNKTLMKMFGLLGIGERAGSGIPDIYQVWEDAGWVTPEVEESFNPDRTRLILTFKAKQIEKASEQNKRIENGKSLDKSYKITDIQAKSTNKTSEQNKRTKTIKTYALIREFLDQNGLSKTRDIAEYIGLSPVRTRAILAEMPEVVSKGSTNNRSYCLAGEV